MALDLNVFHNDIFSFLNQYYIKEDGGLFIAKTNDQVRDHSIPSTKDHGTLNLKGLIFRESESGALEIVAPGVPVPLEQEDKTSPVSCYSTARDGILYRFYHLDGQWRFSTSGCINPDTYWGPKGTPTFRQLVQSAIDAGLVNFDLMIPGYCYFAILESPDFTNLIKHEKLRLTLLDIINCNTVQLEHVLVETDRSFKAHESFFLVPSVVGYVTYYGNGNIFRNETDWAKRATAIKPNLPNPVFQYVELLQKGGLPRVNEFLEFFPWHTKQFHELNEKYTKLLDTITKNYLHIKQHGWKNFSIPPRHRAYMNMLLSELQINDGDDVSKEIEKHLLLEDAKRINFLINPFDNPPV